MCIRSTGLSAVTVAVLLWGSAARGQAATETETAAETEFEPEPDNKTIEPPPPGARPPRERPKRKHPPEAVAPAPEYERDNRGGFALELSAGGVSSGSFQGGILVGFGAKGFVFGLMLDALQAATVPNSAPGGMFDASSGWHRVGLATRVPLLRTADGRVSLFAAGDLGVTNRNTMIYAYGSADEYQASGYTWSVGPGLRFWLNNHLSLAYLVRQRWTRLEGPAVALPDIVSDSPDTQLTVRYTQLEGAFQLLCIF